MPHIIVKLWPGKTDRQKALLRQTHQECHGRFRYGQESVSVGFEEIRSQDWKEEVYKPDIQDKWDKLFKKPGYEM